MMSYRIEPIASDVADQVRQTKVSPFGGLPASVSIATGYGPCRSCLRPFAQGKEERTYITYDPFTGVSDLPTPGPVFLHTEPCIEYSAAGFPTELAFIPMLLEAYGAASELVTRETLDINRVDQQIESLLQKTGVDFIHLRNREAGCFIARIVPSS